jgi:hypothetical protein
MQIELAKFEDDYIRDINKLVLSVLLMKDYIFATLLDFQGLASTFEAMKRTINMLPLLIVMHNGVYIKAKIHIGTCEALMHK